MRIRTPETPPPPPSSSPPPSFSFQPRKPARRRPPAGEQAPLGPTPPPVALTLVAAAYDEGSLILTLTFDRPVNISGFDGSAVVVGDPTFNHTRYDGTGGAFVMDPNTVGVYLNPLDEYFGTEVDLIAGAASGIVAVDDGGTWAGTGGGTLPLPYP